MLFLYILVDDIANLGEGHRGYDKVDLSKVNITRYFALAGIEPRSRNSHPASSTIRPRTHKTINLSCHEA